MEEYFSQSEFDKYIHSKEPTAPPLNRIDKATATAKKFKFCNVIELLEDDLTNTLPNDNEEMFINLNFDNNSYSIVIADEPPNPNAIQLTLDGYFQATDFQDCVYLDGTKRKFIFRIV